MPRNGAAARLRLQQAALELYGERGYDATTTAEIAARADVTERTYFRHFADKREVLFDVETTLRDRLTQALADVPGSVAPLEAMLQAFRSLVPGLERDRPKAELRHRVIAATPALRERELAKHAMLSDAVAGALRARAIPDHRADLQAQVGSAALAQSIHRWIGEPGSDLDALLQQAFRDLRELCGAAGAR